jgi:hypothetical protein
MSHMVRPPLSLPINSDLICAFSSARNAAPQSSQNINPPQWVSHSDSTYFTPTTTPSPLTNQAKVRMLRDIHLPSLKNEPFPGKDLKSPYTPPAFPPHPEVEPGKQVYDGYCHCGAVTISVEFKPISELEVLSCNYSLCSRVRSPSLPRLLQAHEKQNGELYIYPKTSAVIVHTGADKLTEYPLVRKESLHTFCSICGVSVLVRVLEEGDPVCPVNVRCFKNVDLEGLKVKEYDGWSKGKAYVVE